MCRADASLPLHGWSTALAGSAALQAASSCGGPQPRTRARRLALIALITLPDEGNIPQKPKAIHGRAGRRQACPAAVRSGAAQARLRGAGGRPAAGDDRLQRGAAQRGGGPAVHLPRLLHR